jgi:hypothetical protein
MKIEMDDNTSFVVFVGLIVLAIIVAIIRG